MTTAYCLLLVCVDCCRSEVAKTCWPMQLFMNCSGHWLFCAWNYIHQSCCSLNGHHYLISIFFLRHVCSATHRVLWNWMTVVSQLATNSFNPDHLIVHAVVELHSCKQRNRFCHVPEAKRLLVKLLAAACSDSAAACLDPLIAWGLANDFLLLFLVQASSGRIWAACNRFHV